jgi:hypothetical protein
VSKPEEKRPFERPRRTWVDNIKMDLREKFWGGTDWIYLNQDEVRWRALLNTLMNLLVPSSVGKSLSNSATSGSFMELGN